MISKSLFWSLNANGDSYADYDYDYNYDFDSMVMIKTIARLVLSAFQSCKRLCHIVHLRSAASQSLSRSSNDKLKVIPMMMTIDPAP